MRARHVRKKRDTEQELVSFSVNYFPPGAPQVNEESRQWLDVCSSLTGVFNQNDLKKALPVNLLEEVVQHVVIDQFVESEI